MACKSGMPRASASFSVLAGDGHTSCWAMVEPFAEFKMLHILIYPFSDGYFVQAVNSETDAKYVGCRILKVGNMDIDEVVNRSKKYINGKENPMHELNEAPYSISSVEMLKLMGAIEDMETVQLMLVDGNETVEVDMQPIPWKFENFNNSNFPSGWHEMQDSIGKPLWQTN